MSNFPVTANFAESEILPVTKQLPMPMLHPPDIHCLIAFLNFGSPDKIDPIDRLPLRHLVILLAASRCSIMDPDIQSLKKEIVDDLDYLFAPGKHLDLSDYLEALLRKIDKFQAAGGYYHVSRARPQEEITPVVELLGNRLAVDRVGFNSPGGALYLIIGDALRHSFFWRLGKCPCGRFFFKKTRGRNYCSAKCEPSSNTNRLKAGYFKSRRDNIAKNKKRLEQESKEKALMKKFQAFLDKTSGETADQMAVGNTLKRLGGWKKVTPWCGKQATDVWKTLNLTDRKAVRCEFGV